MVYYEMKILRDVRHRYILRLYEVYEIDEYIILILEYLKGGQVEILKK